MGEAGEGSGPRPARRGIEHISTKPNAGSKRQRPAAASLVMTILPDGAGLKPYAAAR